MKIWAFSDLHLEFGVPFRHRPPADVDVIVCAGDVATKGVAPSIEWMLSNFGREIPIVFVAGNHEYYGASMQESIRNAENAQEYPNLHFLENDLVEIDGVLFVGGTLWTDFSLFGREPSLAMAAAQTGMNDFKRIKYTKIPFRKFRPIHAFRKHQETRDYLFSELRKRIAQHTVVVSHHAPSHRSISAEFRDDPLSPCYASDLEELIDETQPTAWIHGHVHHHCDYMIGDTRVIANPRGYPGESSGFEPAFTVEISANRGFKVELALDILDRVPPAEPDPGDEYPDHDGTPQS
ncbi:metallophosphoesterase [Rhizobium laguerreae]|uniref:metallophosphoesterase n=1 Tax=Rhizobium laguerreae TaxID=1076926 RepID=UPI001C8FBF83|nr:metallophosphoesterase [Rhizobium laguerreae]MBY3355152.1 phosphatase [Rhizobium laguerreae]MBY3454269.1 phosphatase [Rhizobium laguerreae]MBY3461424.1 phosphatase [Rhizobium laguerreae]